MSVATTFKLKLVTPVKTVFEQEVSQVILPTTSGQITVLPNHAQLVSELAPGELIVTAGSEQFPLAVAGGIIEVEQNTLLILADSAEQPSDIDIAAAEERAKKLAQELAEEERLDITTYNLLQKQLQNEQARILVGKKWRK